MKRFIVINEGFKCKNCGEKNSKLKGTCRNHCRKCLYSLHIDKESPGDRLSDCKELMEPTMISHSGKKGWIIVHKCQKCGKITPNKVADDDDSEKIIQLTQKYNINEFTREQKTRK